MLVISQSVLIGHIWIYISFTIDTRTNAGYYYGYYYINYHIRFQCSNSATHLSSCSQNNYYSYSYYTSSLGVKCGKTSSSNDYFYVN